MSDFKDYFSGHADVYAQARPGYPDELFAYLASLCPGRGLAWDCATGNGQAAGSLARYFGHVLATDASAEQIDRAVPYEGVSYRVGTAENSGLPDESVDLVTVATAMHWFRMDDFFKEVNRVLRSGGILAAWSYFAPSVSPQVDSVISELSRHILGPYWPEEAQKYVLTGYRDIPFPYPLIETPVFYQRVEWNMHQLIHHFMSWSATRNYLKERNKNPVGEIITELEKAWGNPDQVHTVSWLLHVKAGRKE